jgi:hypothetical protein
MFSHLIPKLITTLGTLVGPTISQDKHVATEEIITDYTYCIEDEQEA